MVKRRLGAGEKLFALGDRAEQAYYLTRGEIDLPDVSVRVRPGTLFGEMGLFSADNKRSSAAVAVTDSIVLTLSYQTFLTLYYQNPGFGLNVMRLIMERLQRSLADNQTLEDAGERLDRKNSD